MKGYDFLIANKTNQGRAWHFLNFFENFHTALDSHPKKLKIKYLENGREVSVSGRKLNDFFAYFIA
jgi:hypothetical protein